MFLNHNWWTTPALSFSHVFFLGVAWGSRPMRCVSQGLKLMIRWNSQLGQS
jgi:hypothetical protein